MLPFKGVLHDALGFLHCQMVQPDGRRHTCADFQLNYVECMEAYGLTKGRHMCEKYFEDLQECKYNAMKVARVRLMEMELYKKVLSGEMTFEPSGNYRDSMPYDSYVFGSFMP